ncbi:hypothetical protein CANTEDRAFT_129253 [Yamadazyma tenuis ATCC 10573]|uniref:Rho-GAP domain-containing protein n=1 Tax=Candida tenuis (strain ATCC 10573 / BCRC 21748 / CBS 615 / JCM 9827 / NBRC 10315 / NRRL Y-1498 / VKM Y-70) TaxID=590646 RepID=G3AY99_CANTC|nr:uncharacterized protein CANTEDRAFT_129253 [Yamadazyma tenuis ATCC 10573]EGV65797.1 hypothetical protein CANTEDRAFT_129253 [Yamadazyma tenuis ATCC 10573]
MSFTDSFWTSEYNTGCRVLFDQLYEGVKENEAFIKLFEKRSESESIYGNLLNSINLTPGSSKRMNDDNYVSSIKNAYSKINENFVGQGNYHVELSESIDSRVISPFSKWCKEHKERVEYSDSVLSEKYKAFKTYKLNLEKVQKKYFNKCRILEDFKNHLDEDELSSGIENLSSNISRSTDDENDKDDFLGEVYKFGDLSFDEANLKQLLKDLIKNIDIKDHKVAILGTYNNVSSGSSITQWLLKNVPGLQNDFDKVEGFGQDLINHGFIRLIGTINNNKNFINSSQFYYQWKPKTFDLIGYDNTDEVLSRSSSVIQQKTQISDYFEDMKQVIGVNSVDFNDKGQYIKISQEVNYLDQKYYQMVLELDKLRCNLEELIMDHLSFMEKCEFDRLKAIRKVLFDFLKVFQEAFKDNKTFLDELSILEETINPVNDLKFFIENFKIGKFKPTVVLYDNYYNSNVNQSFGVDLTIKSRLDKKVVPILVQCCLSHLDRVYPDVINDEERINLWEKPVSLSNIHGLRFKLNHLNTTEEITEVLKKQHPLIITNLLKLYLLELPDSLISSSYFEIIKSLYTNYPINTNDESIDNSRINGLQNVLVEMPKCNLATLDAILTHLNRLVQIIGKKDPELAGDFKVKLSKEFSSILIIPKHHGHFLADNFQFNLMVDLFNNKEIIFKELRRNNSGNDRSGDSIRKKKKAQMNSQESNKSNLPSVPVKNEVIRDAIQRAPVTPKPIEKDAPSTPKSSATTPGLRRSNSPNKKSLNSYLDKGTRSTAKQTSTPIVSSLPAKKDINLSELGQPKFAPSLGRRPSVKDLAQQFDSPSTSPTPKSSASSAKSLS